VPTPEDIYAQAMQPVKRTVNSDGVPQTYECQTCGLEYDSEDQDEYCCDE